jgi:RNA polymerase sigma-70 factor (sigma-E family)
VEREERVDVEMPDVARPPSDATFVDLLDDELLRVQHIARLLVGNSDIADDLVAEAIARTLPKWRSGTVADPPAYLRRVLVNLAHRRWRRSRLSLRHDHRALDWLQTVDDSGAITVERDRTLRALAKLPARRRAVVVLRFYDDLPEARIAEVLGVSLGTVKSTLSRALRQLRDDLEAQEQA